MALLIPNYGEGQALVGRFTFTGRQNDIIYLTIGVSSEHFDVGTL